MSEDRFDGRDFYELMQAYRHAREWMPHTVVEAFEAVKTFTRAAQSRQPEPWISVEDRLPDGGIDVLAWEDGAIFAYRLNKRWVTREDGMVCSAAPTHWMPLPSPPTASGNDAERSVK